MGMREIRKGKHSFYAKYIKRVLDIVLSLVGIVLLSPMMLIIAILVRVKLGSPVVFRQMRPGKDEKIFALYKFRTMTEERDREGKLLPDEERLTGFGKKLRSSSLDELPELINILKGEMSIVGPRPLLVEYLPYYTKEERHRHDVRPGLTGLAQVEGRNVMSWDKRFATDIFYINHISFLTDLRIIQKTIRKVIQKEDILTGKEHIWENLDVERRDKRQRWT